MGRPQILLPEDIKLYCDSLFGVAKQNMLAHGFMAESLVLLNRKGRRKIVTSVDGDSFVDCKGALVEAIRYYQAVAAVHVAPVHVTWLKEAAVAGHFAHKIPPGEPSKLVMGVGFWPAREYSYLRLAEVIETAGTRDLVELEMPGTRPAGWLQDLLPQR